MLPKNAVVLASTLHSPCSFAPNPQGSLGYKSSISNTSQSDDDQYPHGYSYTSFNHNKQNQSVRITLAIKQNTYDLECHSAQVFKRQLQTIFSVCRLNQATEKALKMVLINRIIEFNTSFYCLLAESVQEYQKERESAMLSSNQLMIG